MVMAMPAATNLMHFTRPQPNMMGMARKNVNSAAAVREQPASMSPMMVALRLLVPGMMANTLKQPILSAVFQSISSTSVILNSDARLDTLQPTRGADGRAVEGGFGLAQSTAVAAPRVPTTPRRTG